MAWLRTLVVLAANLRKTSQAAKGLRPNRPGRASPAKPAVSAEPAIRLDPAGPANQAGSAADVWPQVPFLCEPQRPSEPYEFIGLGAMHVTRPYKFIWFGDISGPKPYKFIGLRRANLNEDVSTVKRICIYIYIYIFIYLLGVLGCLKPRKSPAWRERPQTKISLAWGPSQRARTNKL